MTILSDKTREILTNAINEMLDRDTDRSKEENGIGFNKEDSFNIHEDFDNNPITEDLLIKHAHRLWKYRKTQLAEAGFNIEEIPEMSSKGTRREVLLQAEPKVEVADDDLNPGKSKAVLEFMLPKGSYATTVLREYMKLDPLKIVEN